ncbi:hypothetical protein [Mesomycoplasma lagogenitalium]|uniref:Uncharacterized protein n=1 Tax=Mesomycoplasma lagogenitalium TaxID=171286 RepID=A0ABY8LV62_9BACT|nr:hypothetical protein [Mesomycoplasma lagogenitalium]WGI36645.1 hypothetical protein QEG99_04240 [Mesomycoplasma lagogenitalium]
MAAFKPNKEIVFYLENKIKKFKKISKVYFWSNIILSISIILANILSIILAILYLDNAANIIIADSDLGVNIHSKSQWIEILKMLSFTSLFVVFLIAIFFLSVFLTFFNSSFEYKKYKKIQRQLAFYITKYHSKNSKYTLEQFKEDLQKVEPIFLNWHKRSSKKELKKILFKRVK